MTPTHEPWDMHAAQTPLSSSMEEDARLSLYWCGLPWASPHSTPHHSGWILHQHPRAPTSPVGRPRLGTQRRAGLGSRLEAPGQGSCAKQAVGTSPNTSFSPEDTILKGTRAKSGGFK